MLYMFDIDAIAKPGTVEILPGVREWFKALDWTSNQVAIVASQDGLQTRQEIINRLSEIEQDLVPPTQELQSEIHVGWPIVEQDAGVKLVLSSEFFGA